MKLMILSNSPHVNSGYSTVVMNLAEQLLKLNYQVSITGMQSSYRMEEYRGIPVYPLMSDFHEASSIQAQINRLILNLKDHQSEALLCLFQGDSLYNPFTQVHPKTIWYVPIEGQIVYKNHPLFTTARKVKKVVSMTHSAGKQLSDHGIENSTIYHGYDLKVFNKNYKKDLKELVVVYFPQQNEEITMPAGALTEFKDKMGIEYLIGYGGQNFGVRKRPERLLHAFSIFARDKKDAHLHMHCYPVSSRGLNLLEICDYYNIKDKVTFSYGNIRSSGWSPHALNLLYNQFNIFASASSGEGFGLMHLESMAVGVPQIAPDVEPFREFFGEGNEARGLLAESTEQMTPAGELRGLVDVGSLAEKMEFFYDITLRKQVGRNCEQWARNYSWDKIAKQFDTVFKETQA
jgi:glycosyltransferase involved in cell wall biosynthesis